MIKRIKRVSIGKNKQSDKWLVELPCCGKEVVKRNDVIKDWESDRTTRCRRCNSKYMSTRGAHGIKEVPKMTDEAREAARALALFNEHSSKQAPNMATPRCDSKVEADQSSTVWPSPAQIADRREQDEIDHAISMIAQSSNHRRPWGPL